MFLQLNLIYPQNKEVHLIFYTTFSIPVSYELTRQFNFFKGTPYNVSTNIQGDNETKIHSGISEWSKLDKLSNMMEEQLIIISNFTKNDLTSVISKGLHYIFCVFELNG